MSALLDGPVAVGNLRNLYSLSNCYLQNTCCLFSIHLNALFRVSVLLLHVRAQHSYARIHELVCYRLPSLRYMRNGVFLLPLRFGHLCGRGLLS